MKIKMNFTIIAVLLLFKSYSQEIPFIKVNKEKLGISTLKVDVEVYGNIATTTYDMLFFNPTNKILEGELNFPLGEGQDVVRLALEINGHLRESVVVEKELGRIAFEAVVRRGVDPVLLEKVTGNNYKARIYPIPANGYKRIVLAFTQKLQYQDEGQEIHLPFNFNKVLDKFRVHVAVFTEAKKPLVKSNSLDLKFTKNQLSYTALFEKENYLLNKNLDLIIPIQKNNSAIIRSDNYFYLSQQIKPEYELRDKPKSIDIFWDASYSMRNRDIESELKLLDLYFSDIQNLTVNTTIFSNEILEKYKFKINNGNWNELRTVLKTVVYDGATDYCKLEDSINNSKNKTMFFFTDLMNNLSEWESNFKANVFVVNSISISNHELARKIVKNNSGDYINLKKIKIEEALHLLKYKKYELIAIETNNDKTEIYPKQFGSISNGINISGSNFVKGQIIKLKFGYKNDVQKVLKYIIPSETINNGKLDKIFVNNKIKHLQKNKESNKEEIISLSKKYNVISDFTSMIVLDDVRDYLKYNIEPPVDLKEAYEQLKKSKDSIIVFRNVLERNIDDDIELNEGEEIIGIEEDEIEEIVINPSIVPVEAAKSELRRPNLQSRRMVRERSSQDIIAAPRSEDVSSKKNRYKGSLKVAVINNNAKYLQPYSNLKSEKAYYNFYLKQRENYVEYSAYLIDIYDLFIKKGYATYANRILSNLIELDVDNYEKLKVYAYKLEKSKQNKLTVIVYKMILKLRPEDSQSYRDLALAYQTIGEFNKAAELLNYIISGEIYKKSHRRKFSGINSISKNEIQQLFSINKKQIKEPINEKYAAKTNFDIRVVIDWNHNDTDMDLHIIEPTLEECYYGHQSTEIGGKMSDDMTQGFGPEEYTLKKAKKGLYYIKVKYYGDRYQKIENPTFIKVTIFRDYGKKNETKEIKVIRLSGKSKDYILAKIKV